MVSDLSVVVISLSVIVLCWAIVRLNQKLDESIRKPQSPNDLPAWRNDYADSTHPEGNKTPSGHV